ncbi:hypothetical protein [Acidovorax sp.]|uniref:hypothetical protein n=1 Tax=Acidovorax sp. TaxID=1872122 RepID=UPI0025BCF769|nr:hypothetical protein [Acidovorax sp.]MCI5068422.1 hypothetical protein [Acidovorax sp.]
MSALKPDTLPEGVPFLAGAAVIDALKSAADLTGAKILDNPARASDLSEGERIIFFEDQTDKLLEQPSQRQYRTYGFSIGVISRSVEARRAAHRDYRAVKRVLRSLSMPAITQAGIEIAKSGIREGEVRYRLENIDVGGSLVLGLFTLDYRDPL